MGTVYAVVCDTNGAHESDDVMSVWTTREKAEAEVARLRALRAAGGHPVTTHGGAFAVLQIPLDTPSDEFLN